MKKLLFIGFLLTSLALIVLIWADHLSGDQAGSPGYYRATQAVDAALYATRTAADQNLASVTPGPTRQHKHQNGNPAGQSVSLTPTPTIDWDAREDDQ